MLSKMRLRRVDAEDRVDSVPHLTRKGPGETLPAFGLGASGKAGGSHPNPAQN
jgi:hypothetical protein